MSSIMILLALVGGAMLSMQAAINGRLGSQVGVFRSAFLTFAVGALITALLIFILPPSVDNAAGCAEMAAAGRILRGSLYRDYGGGGAAYRYRDGHGGGNFWPTGHESADR